MIKTVLFFPFRVIAVFAALIVIFCFWAAGVPCKVKVGNRVKVYRWFTLISETDNE